MSALDTTGWSRLARLSLRTSRRRLVGWPVAVANAEPEAKDVARTVVGHVDEGGLAEALEMLL